MYEEIIQTLPEVLYKDKKENVVKKSKFKPNRIYDRLIKETNLSKKEAEKITLDVFRFIASSNLKTLTAPLIRELVSYSLSKFGFEIARLQNTRIGFPYKDLEEKINNCQDVNELKDFIYRGVIAEFTEVKKLIGEKIKHDNLVKMFNNTKNLILEVKDGKICSKCEQYLPATVEFFHREKKSEDGLRSDCKGCRSEYMKEYQQGNFKKKAKYQKEFWEKNKEEINKGRREARQNNKEEVRKRDREYYEANKEIKIKRAKEYYEANKERVNERKKIYIRKRRENDPQFHLHSVFSRRINHALKRKGISKNGYSWEKIVGYTTQDLMEHLEKQFKDGMNWDNYGKWHVDHIKPVSLFNFTSYEDEEFQECWALKNLQPLWAEENLKKGANWENKHV